MKKILVLLAAVFLLGGCGAPGAIGGFGAGMGVAWLAQKFQKSKYQKSANVSQLPVYQQRQLVRKHIFSVGLSPKAFLKEWGKPDKQGVWQYNIEKSSYEVTEWKDRLGDGEALKMVWVYENKPDDEGRILFFRKNYLSSTFEWKAYQEKERQELLPNDEIKGSE